MTLSTTSWLVPAKPGTITLRSYHTETASVVKSEGPINLSRLIESWLKEHYSEKAGLTTEGSIYIWSGQKPEGPIFIGKIEDDRVALADPHMVVSEVPAAKIEFFQELDSVVKAWLKKEKSNG